MKKKKKDRYYFTDDTEEAIIEYNSTNDVSEKNKIYNERLKYPLEKLVENVFNTFKFEYFLDDPLDVQQEVLSFVLLNLHKYKDRNKGKAFSYFSIVVKNYLILHNNKNFRVNKLYQDVDSTDEVLDIEDDYEKLKQENHIDEFVQMMYEYWEKEIPMLFEKDRDLQIAYAVIELFRYIDVIDVFKKKTIYLLLREMTGYGGQHITPVINKMKPKQLEIYNNFLEHGKLQ